ncbi:homocysteine S-methyltransferase family protein [Methylophaga sp. OBS4]|uniref:homocysteine S-methyltransferase family protein n=1 Tax=Methylophaga sp. OBS4 TaxID=2991935 RepID=UPI0022596532|nr:homocysteine S-methyltransferase family protein [Methylophaga sp. OBS4]MCX4186906.1 homocysteine S-methyltransferase family protein [Methylophaga sp. OBS4]
MSKYRNNLPQLRDKLFVTDGGLETTLVFHEELALPLFAAFDLLKDEQGIDTLRSYYERYATIARQRGMGFILEAPTWRASRDWAEQLGYDAVTLADANRKAIGLMLEVRETYETSASPMVISGNLGPRGDGYVADTKMSVTQARDYHKQQIETFAQTDADMVSVLTLNYIEEAMGIALAARDNNMPVAISFTVETDGLLPSGDTLAEAIQKTDEATDAYPVYYMINCAHPTHFEHVLNDASGWRERIHGVRANASKRSHAELDESTELDDGNPRELGNHYQQLRQILPNLNVLGGCCGTDHRHVEAICSAVA